MRFSHLATLHYLRAVASHETRPGGHVVAFAPAPSGTAMFDWANKLAQPEYQDLPHLQTPGDGAY